MWRTTAEQDDGMTETEERWAERVAAWRASGQTSREYCEGRDFTAGGLRHWAYRLRKAAGLKASSLACSLKFLGRQR